MGEHRRVCGRRLVGELGRIALALSRIVLTALAVLVVLWVFLILAFSSVLADPTSGSGEGPGRGRTVTDSNP